MSKPLPTQNYVLIQFVQHAGKIIHLPDGAAPSSRDGDIIVLATGPDVPKQPPMPPGTKVVLRGGNEHGILGMDAETKTGLIKHELIVAVLADEAEITDEEIEKIAAGA